MSERPKWMPTSGESSHLFFRSGSFHTDEEWSYAFDAFAKRLGLRAQIAVLEEEDAHMIAYFGGTYTDENREWRQAKIAALRKEIGG